MTPVVGLWNAKAGSGATTLAYNLAWMIGELGVRVLAADLDPQADLTATFYDDRTLGPLWSGSPETTIVQAVAGLVGGDVVLRTGAGNGRPPGSGAAGGVPARLVSALHEYLWFVPGDLALACAEEPLGVLWGRLVGGDEADVEQAVQGVSALGALLRRAAADLGAAMVLVDIAPGLGSVTRAALVACDHVVVPVAADLASLQGLAVAGPAMRRWRATWEAACARAAALGEPAGGRARETGPMEPVGYIVRRRPLRLDRAVGPLDPWSPRIPGAYRRHVLGVVPDSDVAGGAGVSGAPVDDPECVGELKHWWSLIDVAREAGKPMFLLRSADRALGAYDEATTLAAHNIAGLARALLSRVGVGVPAPG